MFLAKKEEYFRDIQTDYNLKYRYDFICISFFADVIYHLSLEIEKCILFFVERETCRLKHIL